MQRGFLHFTAVLACLFCLAAQHPGEEPAPQRISLLLFYPPGDVRADALIQLVDDLHKDHPGRLAVSRLEVDGPEALSSLIAMEERLAVEEGADFGVVLDGDTYLPGPEALERLPLLVKAGLGAFSDPVEVWIFISKGCYYCEEVRTAAARAEKRFASGVRVTRYDTMRDTEAVALLFRLLDAYDAQGNETAYAFVGDRVLGGQRSLCHGLEEAIGARLAGPPEGRKIRPLDSAAGALFSRLTWLTILGAGLADGINPCAFVTMVFLITTLRLVRRTRRELLLVGGLYAATVFLTYLVFGILLYETARGMSGRPVLANLVYYGALALVVLFAGASIHDALAYARGRPEGMIAVLPEKTRSKIKRIFQRRLSGGNLVIGAVSTGFLVSFLEGICTGQLYLPAILGLSREAETRPAGYGYLALYCLMFILPLIAVFGIAYLGLTSERLARFSQKNVVAAKLAMAGVFVLMAVWLTVMK